MRMQFAFACSALLGTWATAPCQPPVAPRPTRVLKADEKFQFLQGDIIALDANTVTVGPGLGWNKLQNVPVKLPFHTVLQNGNVHDFSFDGRAYRKSDLRVGDNVCIEIVKDNGNDFCAELTIRKRPGGLVPPSVRFRESTNWRWPPYHIQMNIYNLIEDGVPIPEWVRSLTGNSSPIQSLPTPPIPDRIPPAKK